MSITPPRKGNPARSYGPATFNWTEEALVGTTPRIAAVILAAGHGSRFGDGSPKPLARLGKRSLLGHAVAAATASGSRPVVVVVGYRADEVAGAAGTLAQVIVNPEWEQGMATSLRCALVALMPDPTVTAVAVALGDQPKIGADAYRRLATAHRDGAALAVATYRGVRGHPVLIGREHWAEAVKLEGDEGARSLLAAHAVVEVDCDGTGDPSDVDTPADLAALEGS
jgi:molybdenum cofactor cytidylyltransferase/nicotine blue oxidoreductase